MADTSQIIAITHTLTEACKTHGVIKSRCWPITQDPNICLILTFTETDLLETVLNKNINLNKAVTELDYRQVCIKYNVTLM